MASSRQPSAALANNATTAAPARPHSQQTRRLSAKTQQQPTVGASKNGRQRQSPAVGSIVALMGEAEASSSVTEPARRSRRPLGGEGGGGRIEPVQDFNRRLAYLARSVTNGCECRQTHLPRRPGRRGGSASESDGLQPLRRQLGLLGRCVYEPMCQRRTLARV